MWADFVPSTSGASVVPMETTIMFARRATMMMAQCCQGLPA